MSHFDGCVHTHNSTEHLFFFKCTTMLWICKKTKTEPVRPCTDSGRASHQTCRNGAQYFHYRKINTFWLLSTQLVVKLYLQHICNIYYLKVDVFCSLYSVSYQIRNGRSQQLFQCCSAIAHRAFVFLILCSCVDWPMSVWMIGLHETFGPFWLGK